MVKLKRPKERPKAVSLCTSWNPVFFSHLFLMTIWKDPQWGKCKVCPVWLSIYQKQTNKKSLLWVTANYWTIFLHASQYLETQLGFNEFHSSYATLSLLLFVFFGRLGNPSHLVWEAARVGRRPGCVRQKDWHEQRGSGAHPGQDALLRGPRRMVGAAASTQPPASLCFIKLKQPNRELFLSRFWFWWERQNPSSLFRSSYACH